MSEEPPQKVAKAETADGGGASDIEYTFHCYDHCPFGNRAAFLMDKFGIRYKKVVYGYGSGAVPSEYDGHGYTDADLDPRKLTGKKMLPVLEGPGVPCAAPDHVGMAESLEICSYLIGRHDLVVPCASGRSDVDGLIKSLINLMGPLCMERMTKMPVPDWADPRDVAYHLWKHEKKGDVMKYDDESGPIADINAKLAGLPDLMRGEDKKCLNSWGWGMDDVLLLPWLRRLTCVKGIEFPAVVQQYMAEVGAQVEDYSKHAI